MGLHKIVQEGGEIYLPFAKSRMAALVEEAAANFGVASRVIRSDDGAVIRLEVQGEEQFIHITVSAAVKYQFFCTGAFVRTSYHGGIIESWAKQCHGYSVKVTAGAGGVKATPCGSTIEADPNAASGTARWEYSPDGAAMTAMFPKKNLFQANAINEHVFYPGGGRTQTGTTPNPWLLSSWSASTPVGGMLWKSGLNALDEGTHDVAFDAAPSLFNSARDSEPVGSTGLVPDADWYRRAALQRVTDGTYGTRTFLIMFDVSGDIHVYPANAEIDGALRSGAPASYIRQQIKTNVPQRFVKTARAPLPAWCRKPLYSSRDAFPPVYDSAWVAQYQSDVPQYLWNFDSAGTKACCIVYEDLDPPTLLNGSVPTVVGVPNNGKPVQETLPGLIEVGLEIVLTGASPDAFTFTPRLLREFRPSVDKRYFVAADYAWVVKAPAVNPAPEVPPPNITDLDDLVVMTGHVYHTSNERERYGSDTAFEPGVPKVSFAPFAAKGLLRVSNLTKGKVVRDFLVHYRNDRYISTVVQATIYSSWVDNMSPSDPYFIRATANLLAYDLRILAFALQQQYSEQAWHLQAPYGNQFLDRKQAQRLQVYAYNELVAEKFIDPDSTLNTGLAATHGNLSTAGLYEYPIDDVGVFNPYQQYDRRPEQSIYNQLALPAAAGEPQLEYRTAGANGYYLPSPGPYHAGALLYAQLIYPHLVTPLAWEKFVVHPSGSWSFTSHPVYYYAGPIAPYRVGTDFDPGLMRQGRIDVLCFKVRNKNVMTSHLDCFNQAFGKSLREEDFLYQFSKVDVTAAGITPSEMFLRLLAVRVPADPISGEARVFYYPVGSSSRGSYINPPDIFLLDARRKEQFFDSLPSITPVVPGSYYQGYTLIAGSAPISDPTALTPFTRGSGLFF